MWFWRSTQVKSTKLKGKSEGISLVAFCIFTVALAVLAGCTTAPPRKGVQLKQATVEELTALLSQREAAIHSMKGLFTATVREELSPSRRVSKARSIINGPMRCG